MDVVCLSLLGLPHGTRLLIFYYYTTMFYLRQGFGSHRRNIWIWLFKSQVICLLSETDIDCVRGRMNKWAIMPTGLCVCLEGIKGIFESMLLCRRLFQVILSALLMLPALKVCRSGASVECVLPSLGFVVRFYLVGGARVSFRLFISRWGVYIAISLSQVSLLLWWCRGSAASEVINWICGGVLQFIGPRQENCVLCNRGRS